MAAGSIMDRDLSTAQRYETLIRISNSIRDCKGPQELFELLVQALGKAIRFDAIAQFDESANKVNWHLGPGCQQHEDCASEDEGGGETLPRLVYRTQETIVLGALDGDTLYPVSTRKMRANGLRSVCAFPLTTAHRRLGSLIIGSTQANAYSAEEVRFCSLVADQIALAIDDAINFQASQKAQERLELLLDLTNRVLSSLNLREVLREISAQVRRVMHCEGVGIDLPSPEDGKLRIYALDFPDSPVNIEEGYEPPENDQTSAVRVFRVGEPVILSSEELVQEAIDERFDIRSLAHVPLTGHGSIVGVLSLGARRDRAFSLDGRVERWRGGP